MTNSEQSSVVFTEHGAVYRPDNGHVIRYRRVAGIYYHTATPTAVVSALELARTRLWRIRIYYGNADTGRDWLEEWDVEGTIGCSVGPLKVPLLIRTCRSSGGSALLDHCIVKIKWTGKSGGILYQHPRYHAGTFTIREIGPEDTIDGERLRAGGYSHAVDVDGQNHANFRSHRAAVRFVDKMTG